MFKIFKGEAYNPQLNVQQKLLNGLLTPYDLTGFTEIEARMKNADGTVLSKKQSLSGITNVTTTAGSMLLNLASADTMGLLEGENQTIDLYITKDSVTRIVSFGGVSVRTPPVQPATV